ncbi:SDR family oxidoreductase [Hespellia stercorisuis]|uniref:NAD(P)-dependent dehydrogenase, short-chain alcohol dehydrogenase family n=1 Tax=Hespellia stercorisuis DSM 15480 TaxID=1121950 RepID=A0A1M6MTD9_9FIRM|nr:SDR family oxidoreductase [Hespellia stercorisuis]SHJ86660.1 NAD(P)-dependent dehydrogenase, short-chain alcohol dehydrogenase family [Hespellia stercorisuis DSM 15480]
MGLYAITGASGGIGGKAAEMIRAAGHTVINIDIKDADINANLATPEGRKKAIEELRAMASEGLDAMICVAGVSAMCGKPKLIISVNYFGTVELVEGVYDLLRKKHGCVVVTASNTISQGAARMDIVDLLNNTSDEKRILSLLEGKDPAAYSHAMYVSSKYALSRWMRRSSPGYAAEGVRINAIAPGNVATPMTADLTPHAWEACLALPIPTLYHQKKLMDPEDISKGIVFLASDMASGVNGIILFVDGGTDALLNSEKVY